MNKEVKEQWIEALKSGRYSQGRKVLRAGNDFCCLGVLCDLYFQEKEEDWKVDEDGNYLAFKRRDILSQEVQKWAGLESGNPCVNYGWRTDTGIANLNDSNVPFRRLADLIEEQL